MSNKYITELLNLMLKFVYHYQLVYKVYNSVGTVCILYCESYMQLNYMYKSINHVIKSTRDHDIVLV